MNLSVEDEIRHVRAALAKQAAETAERNRLIIESANKWEAAKAKASHD